jgi:hypothetical protein
MGWIAIEREMIRLKWRVLWKGAFNLVFHLHFMYLLYSFVGYGALGYGMVQEADLPIVAYRQVVYFLIFQTLILVFRCNL